MRLASNFRDVSAAGGDRKEKLPGRVASSAGQKFPSRRMELLRQGEENDARLAGVLGGDGDHR
jgi:hypothetical protein